MSGMKFRGNKVTNLAGKWLLENTGFWSGSSIKSQVLDCLQSIENKCKLQILGKLMRISCNCHVATARGFTRMHISNHSQFYDLTVSCSADSMRCQVLSCCGELFFSWSSLTLLSLSNGFSCRKSLIISIQTYVLRHQICQYPSRLCLVSCLCSPNRSRNCTSFLPLNLQGIM